MTDLRTAAQQALDFIRVTNRSSSFRLVPESNLNKTIIALRDALAQCPRCGKITKPDDIHTCSPQRTAAPARTLTDEVIADLWYKNGTHHHHFARAIERWLRGEG